jgi:tRNA/tmRNA/rRNA uracil-C5-methylase (TrmA/RlmC/RlmD family)
MAQELGRISRPTTAQYEGRRKLLLVPLVYGPPAEAPDGVAALQKYWTEMQLQVDSLQAALDGLHHIYHESLYQGGQEGLEYLEKADQRSHQFVKAKCELGAVLEATEDAATLAETLDLQRCLMMPLASEKVALRLHEWFNESNKSRYENIASQIDTTLGQNEVGMLLVSERHQIQFPKDIEVFYVSPPALDEFRRWLQNWVAQQQKPPEETAPEE